MLLQSTAALIESKARLDGEAEVGPTSTTASARDREAGESIQQGSIFEAGYARCQNRVARPLLTR